MINESNQSLIACPVTTPLILLIAGYVTLIVNQPLTIETNPRDSSAEDAYYYHTVMNQHLDL